MKKYCVTLLLLLLLIGKIDAQVKTLQERLGYSKDTRLLILHADDIGVSHSENAATIAAMEKGSVNSGSIMVPCPWFPEIAEYAKTHPLADFGLHLTLTSEWRQYKWGPVVSRDQVPGLVDSRGHFYGSVEDVGKHASVEEVERELRAQIERAREYGVNPTHFDTHMGSVMAKPEFIRMYIKLGREYKVPVLLNGDDLQSDPAVKSLRPYASEKDIVVDRVIMASHETYQGGMPAFYTEVLTSLNPGLNVLLLHAAYDNDEMQAVTAPNIDYASAWRQADYDFFTSAACKRLIAEQHIRLITWREIKDKLVKE